MPKKIYMSEQFRPGCGVTFDVSWDRIEDFLRGNAKLEPHEDCEFVITKDGIKVYVVDKK